MCSMKKNFNTSKHNDHFKIKPLNDTYKGHEPNKDFNLDEHADRKKKSQESLKNSFPNKILFLIRINKSAGTAIHNYLHGNGIDYFSHEIMWRPKEFIYQCINEPAYRMFTCVRNPWSRAFSSYTFTFRYLPNQQPTFREFLEMPFEDMIDLEPDPKFVYHHCKPQLDFITDENGSIDYLEHIGRTENIQDTCNWICETAGVTENFKIEMINSQHRKTIDYKKYYDDYCKKLVAKKYEQDIDTFKYTFDT